MTATQSKFSVEIFTEVAGLHRIASEWQDLASRCDSAPFQMPQWVILWADSFLPERIRVVAVYSGSTLVALAPLLVYPREEERVLAFMAGGVSDYLDILVDNRFETEALAHILHALADVDRWTTLDLTDVPASSVLHRTLLSESRTAHDCCSVLSLPQSTEDLLHLLSKRQRANLRNARSRLQRAGGATVEIATSETLDEFLDDLFRLHTNRWSGLGEPGVLADGNIRNFHENAAPALLAQGALRFYRLRVERSTVAALYAMRSRDTLFCYLQGFDPDFSQLSPGTHLIFCAMQDAIELRIRRFDFLRGDEEYKRHWRPQAEATYRMQAPRSAILLEPAKHDAAA